eukprot:TRINITY_DN21187_c0_g1_i1.p1 TRINITY_DN21187_c0_g1~~TRINITY_DN21187_c0_g1_i1.p1  ORF type:complete len:269 (-),score=62.43 TRINITY_DN21187_c0_g1_i1:28-738(-)
MTVLVGARSVEKGSKVVEDLKSENAKFIHIDLDDEETIRKASEHVKSTFGGLDILINNAAMAFKGDAWGEQVAQQTFKTNYTGTKQMCAHFLPLLNPHGRLVNVSSGAGRLGILQNESLKAQFTDPSLTEEKLDDLVQTFFKAVKEDNYAQLGFPKSCYGMSKLALNCYTRILMRKSKDDILINCVCPGWCQTNMSSFSGSRTAAKGAETPVWLALIPPQTEFKQGFYRDLQIIDW